jgi:uncharacterized protein YxjI
VLDRRTFFVRERVGLFRLVDRYDILDPTSGLAIGFAKERVGAFTHLLRLVLNKRLLPTKVEVRETEAGPVVLTIRRKAALFRPTVTVTDSNDREIGRFKAKLFSLGGGFHVFDALDNRVAEIKGDWKGWNFRFLTSDGAEIGTVTKKWAGLGRELFTSADNYMIALDGGRTFTKETAALLLAAGLAIDIVYKEKG